MFLYLVGFCRESLRHAPEVVPVARALVIEAFALLVRLRRLLSLCFGSLLTCVLAEKTAKETSSLPLALASNLLLFATYVS